MFALYFTVGLISLQKTELEALNLSSIPVKDADEYVATVNVFHDLHCLVSTNRPGQIYICNSDSTMQDYLRKQIYNATHYQISAKQFPVQDDHIGALLY